MGHMFIHLDTLDLRAGDSVRGTRSMVHAPVQLEVDVSTPAAASSLREPRMLINGTISDIAIRLSKAHYDLIQSTITHNFSATMSYRHPSQYSVQVEEVVEPATWDVQVRSNESVLAIRKLCYLE